MSDSILSIYRGENGYFLVAAAKTTAGVWQDLPEPPALVDALVDSTALGREVMDSLATLRQPLPHPRRDEWGEVRRRSVTPILRSANVDSWRAFVAKAALVQVERSGETFTVTPMKPLSKPIGAYEPNLTHELMLLAPTSEMLGEGISRAFTAAAPAP